jgi:hypothetical protein
MRPLLCAVCRRRGRRGVTGYRWGTSVLDWDSHAVDPYAAHSSGVHRAVCGHPLMQVTQLHKAPGGRVCAGCAAAAGGAR